MFEVLNNFSVTLLEVICSRIYFDTIFQDKNSIDKKKSYLLFAAQAILFVILCAILRPYMIPRMMTICLTMTCLFGFMKDGKIWKIFLISATFLLYELLFDYITFLMISAFFEQFDSTDIGDTLAGRLCVIIERTLLMLLILFFKMRADKKKGRGLVETEWIRFLIFPVFTIIASISMIVVFNDISEMRQANVLYAISFGMVIMNLYIYNLINDIVDREVSIKEREVEYAQFRNQVDIYHTIRDSLERQRERAHEFKNHILCVDSLAKGKKYQELEQYISDIRESSYVDRDTIDTNNVIVNTILNEKYNEMMDKGIVFAFRINDLSLLPIEDEDLVVILSNLLENAIEACERIEGKKSIKMRFMIEDEIIILSVKNTGIGLWSSDSNGEFITSKLEKIEEHGIGIRNIENVIQKYGGAYSIKNTNKEFYFAIEIPMKMETQR